MELQQRGVEFSQLFGKYSHLRPPLLERMPPMEVVRHSDNQTNGEVGSDGESRSAEEPSPQHVSSESVCNFFQNNPLSFEKLFHDLLGIRQNSE